MVLYVDAGPSSVITLQDENIHQIQLSNLSQDEQIHDIYRISIFEVIFMWAIIERFVRKPNFP